jgi:hypothetical protein
VATYISLGEVYVARHGELIVGYAQIVESEDPPEFELKSLAVIEARQGEGIGRDLVGAVVARCRERDGRRLIVSTAAAAVGTLRFYQRRGFRMYRVVQDAFGPSTGYPVSCASGAPASCCRSSERSGGTRSFLTGFGRRGSARSSGGLTSTGRRSSPRIPSRTRTHGCSGW